MLVVVYVILQEGESISANELQGFGKQHLATYKSPKVVYIANDFPRTKNGKILRREVSPDIAIDRSTT